MAQDTGNYIPGTIPPNPNRNQRQAQSDPVQYSLQGGPNEIQLELRMLMPYLPKLAAEGQQIAGRLGMSDDWDAIILMNGNPRDHLQTLIQRWLDGDQQPQAPHTLSFFVGVVRDCGKGKVAEEMESKIRGRPPTPLQGLQQVQFYPGYSQHPPYNSQWRRTSSPQVQNLQHSSPHLPQSSHSGQSFMYSGAYQPAQRTEFHEGMDSSTGGNQPPLFTSMEESGRVTHQQMSSQYSGGRSSSGTSHYSFGPGNTTLPYRGQSINPEIPQLGNTTPHDDIQRDYSSTSLDQQQPRSLGTTNVQDIRKQLIETILTLRRQLHHGELEAYYDQTEGQRCVSAREEAEIFKAVFRITVSNPESGKWHGSGCFVKKKGSYWILTACHNLLNKSDGEKLKEGNFQRIEHLEEKMKENLLFTLFVLPDEQLKLTREKHVGDVVGDITHVQLIYDLENDILAIPCNNPEGFGGISFQLKVDAMQVHNPQVGHYLHIVHNPWKIAKREDVNKVSPNQYVQNSIGMIFKIEGKAMLYDNVTYSGSSGAPVFFAGYNGLILVGIHRKCCDRESLNQGSHLTAEFVERMHV